MIQATKFINNLHWPTTCTRWR